MNIRKGNKGELEKIIDIANKSFATDRPAGYDFKKSVAKVYANKNHDFSDSHFVLQNTDGSFVAVAGNLIDNITINNQSYKLSRVGTVSTLPNHRGKGYMQKLLQAIDAENIQNKVVFSILTGERKRYQNFGYDRVGYDCFFEFNKNQQKYLTNQFDIKVIPFSNNDLDCVYDIYLKNHNVVLRDKQNFEICLNNPKYTLYTIKIKNKVVGYFSAQDDYIVELCLLDNKYLQSTLNCILNDNVLQFKTDSHNTKTIKVFANILNFDLCKNLDKLASKKQFVEETSIKVYDIVKFVEMLYYLNLKNRHFADSCEVYKIQDEVYEFSVKNNTIVISATDKIYSKSFLTKTDFIRYATGNSFCDNVSTIFPLQYCLSIADRF